MQNVNLAYCQVALRKHSKMYLLLWSCFTSSSLSTVLTEHQLFDVFNNAIVSFYRSEDEGGGEDGGGGPGGGSGAGGNSGSESSSRNDRGSSSGGGAVNSDSGTPGGGGGDSGNTNNTPSGNGGVGLAAVAGVMTTNDALLFHEKCGTLIKLSNNNKTAERRRPLDEFNNGVVMTNRPLRHNEMFEVIQSHLIYTYGSTAGEALRFIHPNVFGDSCHCGRAS